MASTELELNEAMKVPRLVGAFAFIFFTTQRFFPHRAVCFSPMYKFLYLLHSEVRRSAIASLKKTQLHMSIPLVVIESAFNEVINLLNKLLSRHF